MRLIPLAALVAATLTLANTRALAAEGSESTELSRTPPAVYEQHIAGLLTKLDDVLPGRTAFPTDDTGGVTLLAEYVHYRDDAGTLYRVSHIVYHAATEAAVHQLASDTYHFDRERETIFLVDAATIHPDGRRQPVEAKGAFIQTPQRAANSSLYTSDAELNLIFPNVARGVCTEAIVVVRENTPVIPGHFSTLRTFIGGWPSYLRRQVIDFPEAEMRRVHALRIPAGVPDAVVEKYTSGRERRTWTTRNTPRHQWEERSPDIQFSAPTLWLTTLDDWDTVAAWFQGLVSDRSELGPELEAAVAKWTDGLTDRRAIIDALTTAVANEVRYTGLEFGLAGYQPNPCREVWSKRYGDCKDKANLLRAVLAHKGIRAHVVLLNTESLGLVEKASPSWRQFNHAIVAIEDETQGGGYLFCDPTAKNLPAGSIGLSDIGREVLVVRDGRAVWARTPDVLEAAIRVSAELALAANGELTGWFTLTADGADAASYAEYYNSSDHDDRVRSMQRMVEKFFPGANVMDVDYTPSNGAVRQSKIRAYFVRPARAAKGESLRMPFPTDWLPTLTTVGNRHLPYETVRRTESVDVTIALPEGWSAATLPAAFSAPSDVAQFDAAWSAADGHVTAHLAWHPKKLALGAKDYAIFQRSVRALTAWMEQPLLLAHGATISGGSSGVAAQTGADLNGFPILATGEGQLRLLDEKFPDEKNPARRAALEKVLQWFSNEPDTRFEAELKLAILDWKKNGDGAFADTVTGLLARLGAQVSINERSWGEYLQAKAQWDANHDMAAIESLKRIAADESVSTYRRGWSAQLAAMNLSKGDPTAAAALLKLYVGQKWDAQKEIVATLAECLARSGDVDGLLAWITEFVGTQGNAADALLKIALGRQREKWGEFPRDTQAGLAAAWTTAIADAAQFPETFPALQELRDIAVADNARRAFAHDLAAWLAEHPPAWWTRNKDERFADATAVIEQIKKRNDASDGPGVLDAYFQLVLHHEPTFSDFADYTRWTLWWLDHRAMDEGMFEFIATKVLDLPPSASPDVALCWTTCADHFEKAGQIERARGIFTRVLQSTETKEFQRANGGGHLGLLELRANRVDEALAAFRAIEPMHTRLTRGVDYLYAALLVHLERGDYERGLELLASIRKQEDRYIKEAKYTVPMQHLLRLAEKPERLKYYWQRRELWRPAWDHVLTEAGVQPAAMNEPPLVEDYATIETRITRAIADRDTKELLRALDVYMRLAQWIPLFTTDAIQTATKTGAISEKLQRSLYECQLKIITGLDPVDPQFDGTGRVWEAALLVDTGHPREGAEKSRLLFKDLGVGEKLGESGLRMWLSGSRGLDIENDAIAAARAALEGGGTFVSRIETVRTLSDNYLLRSDAASNRALLERETQRRDFPASGEIGKILLARLEQVRAASATAENLSNAVRAWREKHDLAWLDMVKPLSLEDPRFASRKAAFYGAEDGFTEVECLKFNLLLALDERQTIEQREIAFRMFVYTVAFATNDIERFVEYLEQALESDASSPTNRASLVAMGTIVCAGEGNRAMVERLAATPAFKHTLSSYQASVTSVLVALNAEEDKREGWGAAAFAALTAQPLDYLRAGVAEKVLRHMAYAGLAAEAEALIAGAGTLAVDPKLGRTASNVRLGWTRIVRELKEQLPFLHAVRDAFLALPGENRAPPPIVRRVFTPASVARLTPAERRALVVDTLRTGRGLPERFGGLIMAVGDPNSVRHSNPEMGLTLVELALKSALADEPKSQAVFSIFASLCDADRPEVRKKFELLARDFTTSAAARTQPQTRQSIAFMRAFIALRTSPEARPATLFADLDSSGIAAPLRDALRLRFLFSRGQNDACLALASRLDPGSMSDGRTFFVARAVLAREGRTTEVQLLDETGRSTFERMVAESSFDPSQVATIWSVLSFSALPEAKKLLTEEWFDRVLRANADDHFKHYVQIMRAKLAGDTKTVRDSADALLRLTPDSYDTYFTRGKAWLELGDKGHARDDLRVFLEHCLDSGDYPEALALFRKLAPREKIKIAQ